MELMTMRIGTVAELTGVSRRSIRYYEECGLLRSARADNGWREYDETAVTRVANVRDLLAVGLRVRDIHRISPACLQEDIAAAPACDETIAMYARRLADLDASIATLRRHRSHLAARMDELMDRRSTDHEELGSDREPETIKVPA